jgi:hypothetical protein
MISSCMYSLENRIDTYGCGTYASAHSIIPRDFSRYRLDISIVTS